MSHYSSAAIRNLALLGHAGSGKTSLAEALLEQVGAVPTAGRIERRNTVCDFDPQERELQHSLDSALCWFEHAGTHVNLIDTPGYPDFAPRALAVLAAVETACVVINAQNGIEPSARRMMAAARERGLCRLLVINRIDTPGIDLPALLAELQETFGSECLPINLPADGGQTVLDCYFQPDGGATDFSTVEATHAALIDQVVEVNEALMEQYLEQGQSLSPEQLHDPFEQALREHHLVPVCFVSAKSGAGVGELLRVIEALMPNPAEGNPPPFLKGEGTAAVPVEVLPDPSRHVLAEVFKVVVDPYVGRMGVFRIHQGSIRAGSQLFVGDARKPFKVSHLFRLQGKAHIEVAVGLPGDICAVAKVDELHRDAVIHDSHDEDHHHLLPVPLPPPMYGLAIKPTRRGDEQKLSDALHRLAVEDPGLAIEQRIKLNETVLMGSSELHLRSLLEKMRSQYNVEVETAPPSIAYRETISRPAEGHHRHKKQTGGAGQFGEVYLRIEPLARGAGFEFASKVVGGAIPSTFIPAVEKGVRQVLERGAIAGYPLQDLRVTVVDGKTHPVDGKEVAFVTAGRKALLDAVAQARGILLEPLVRLEIQAPSTAMGDITADVSARRGMIAGSQMRSSQRVEIDARVPLAELGNYASTLKALSGDEGSFTLTFSHYEQAPPKVQQQRIAAFKPELEED